MYSHHPPDVVTLSRLPSGIQTPETDSPLSSSPNSPRSSALEGSMYEAAADLLQDLVKENSQRSQSKNEKNDDRSPSFPKEEGEIMMMEPPRVQHLDASLNDEEDEEEEPPRLPLKTEAPFDEGGGRMLKVLQMDEKKEPEGGDELMGKQAQREVNESYSSSVYTSTAPASDPAKVIGGDKDNDGDGDGDDDESQPPSLAVDRSLTSEIEEPVDGGVAQWTSDRLMTPSPRRTFSGEQPEDPEEEMAAMMRLMMQSTEAPLDEDDDDAADEGGEEEHEPGPLNTTAIISTPIQQLRSPPNILKQTMAWDTPIMPTTTTTTTKSENEEETSPPQSKAVVSPSPENVMMVDDDEEEDVPIDETKETETPNVLRPMISPDGIVENLGGGKDGDEEEYPSRNVGVRRVAPFAQDPIESSSEEEKPTVVAPFHPQGAVSVEEPESKEENLVIEKPKTMAYRSFSEPAVKRVSSGVALKELQSTLSDAVDLAASGAAAIVGDLVMGANKAACGSSSQYTVSATLETEAEFSIAKPGSMLRSVSDMPQRSSDPMTSNDWNKYLQKGGGGMSTASDSKSNMDVEEWLGSNNNHDQKRPGFREMTPKRDFQSSEKSAAWLQEEFKRRSTIKEEINKAILARNDLEDEVSELEGDESVEVFIPRIQEDGLDNPGGTLFATALSKALEALPTSAGSSPASSNKLESTQRSEDDEVAAITTADVSASGRIHSDEEATPKPRRLDYGGVRDTEDIQPTASTASNYTAQTAPGRPYPIPSQLLISKDGQHQRPSSAANTNYQHEMLRFVNDTRAALREKESPSSQFRSLAISSSVGDEAHSIEVTASFNDEAAKTRRLNRPDFDAMTERSLASEAAESSDNSTFDISTTPVLVHSMDSYLGIAKGDITLSLLNENTGRVDTSKKATWANRVHGAIWRCRRMRRSMGSIGSIQVPTPEDERTPGSPARGRSSLPVDMDKARVAGGVRTVQSTQQAALGHLQHDEIDEALELFEDIIFAYYAYFEKSLKAREANPGMGNGGITDFRPYIGVALHNLGILNLLNGEYKEALSYFGRAVENRKACLGEGHPDHVASLVKLATCMYALNEFAEAHAKLEQALVYARSFAKDLGDRMQMAEILNNLGCLAYMCGQPGAANTFYRESLDVQFGVLSHSLYLSSAAVGQSISLNISITRANIGFVKLVTSELPMAVTALENALMEQQLLVKGANSTIIATMDHLAVANLLNGDPQKAAMMFGRILDLQQKEYGAHDRRCYVTADKINMVKSRGTTFEQAVEELRKTFSIPEQQDPKPSTPPKGERREAKVNRASPSIQNQHSLQKTKNQKNKVMKVLTSIRKKKGAN